MRAARIAAQAKINLFLRVGPRRPDGFHDVATMFQLVDLADDIIVRVDGAGRTLHVAGPRIPAAGLGPTDKNLAYRAAVAYAERASWPQGFSIELTKNIPAGGGLGGGSSDAAAVLRALDTLNDRPIGQAALEQLAVRLGSDVPFFVSGSARAFATGRGDEVGGLDPLGARDVLLVVPAYGVATADAYRWIDEDRGGAPRASATGAPPSPDQFESAAKPAGMDEWEFVSRASHNDFEPVVERRHPDLRGSRERLSHSGARIARLSGSGSTVFGIFDALPAMPGNLGADVVVLRTKTSARVVQVEARE